MEFDFLLLAGGVGLFLFGMAVLTDGLRGLAGGALRRLLAKFTRTPFSGAVCGVVTTAIIQSSSATTVTAVGFVAAGLLTFPQALGVIFGANIGTTVTGWLVAVLGFKLQLGRIVLPLVLVGALLRLFGGPTLRNIGWALAGFSLLFFGIDALQQGMSGLEGALTPKDFPSDTLLGRLQLVALGVAITLVTQSSSAGVAMALAALGAGAVTFAQAAAMVIGMDVGTTFTAVLATIGGSAATRRTGYAHVVYNVLTGAVAFFLLGAFAAMARPWIAAGGAGDAQIALVAFHTTFNVVGVALALPFADAFARLITRLVPERGRPLLRRLDERLLGDAASATGAAAATIRDITNRLCLEIAGQLAPERRGRIAPAQQRAVDEALEATRGFLARIRTAPPQEPSHRRHVAALHALDHLLRLAHRAKQTRRIEVLATERRLSRLAAILREAAIALSAAEDLERLEARLDRVRRLTREQRRRYRERMVERASQEEASAEIVLERLDSLRWIQRVSYHLWRIAHHLRHATQEAPPAPEGGEAAHDEEEG